jgi:lactoylglutathione lyase
MRCVRAVALLALGVMCASGGFAQAVKRPRITGISHVAYFVSDLPKAMEFWHGVLGYEEYFSLKKPNSEEVRIAFLRINDRQHVELFTDKPAIPQNMMSHVAFVVDDLKAMRVYLNTQGYKVPAENGAKTKAGDYAFEIHDPVGTLVEFVQQLPTGVEAQTRGKFVAKERISDTIYHVGFNVSDAAKAMDFYGRVLGFQETWRGTPPTNPELSWINMRVPDGVDYVELMLYHAPADPATWGGKNHVALSVPNAQAAFDTLKARAATVGYTRPMVINKGVNGKRQINLFDPDGTRAELMEPFTVDGKPVPSSTKPVPAPDPH